MVTDYEHAYRAAAAHQQHCDPRGLDAGRPWALCMGHACRGMARATGFVGSVRARWSWAVPNNAALDVIAEHGPIVEVGAGGGYWARELRRRGVDALAYDPDPHGRAGWHAGSWGEVLEGDHTVAARHPERTLLLVWPQHTWSSRAVAAYAGRTLIFVGQAPDRPRQLRTPARLVGIPQWAGCTDRLELYER